jgi:putative transposase
MPRPHKPASPFRYFNSSPEVIRLVVLMYARFPLSLRNVEDLLFERGIDICHETVRHWWNRFGPMSAGDIRRQRVSRMRGFRHWRWHLDEMYVKLNGGGETPHDRGSDAATAANDEDLAISEFHRTCPAIDWKKLVGEWRLWSSLSDTTPSASE